MPKISVIIPTRNEEETIADVVKQIPPEYEVILVDSSEDDTIGKARSTRPTVRIIKMPPRGKGLALRVGIHHASGDVVVFMDGDGSHNPLEIPKMVKTLEFRKADIVVASRMPPLGHSEEHAPLHYCGNKLVTWIINKLFRGNLTDSQNGFRVVRKTALTRMKLSVPGFTFETQMSCRALTLKLKMVEVPSLERKRKGGIPKMSLLKYGWRHFPRIFLEYILWLRQRKKPSA